MWLHDGLVAQVDWLDVDKGFSARATAASSDFSTAFRRRLGFRAVERQSLQDLLADRSVVTSTVLTGLGLRVRLPSSILAGDSWFSGTSESCKGLD